MRRDTCGIPEGEWMNKRQWLLIPMLTVIILLFWVWNRFNMNTKQQENTEESQSEDTLTILAPYQLRLQQQILDEVAEEYSSSGIGSKKARFVYIPNDNYLKEISLRLDQGDNTDLIICSNTMMPALIKMGVFQDISGKLTEEKTDSFTYPEMWETAKTDNRYYGIPFTVDPVMLFYNKDRMSDLSLSIPETWDELADTAEKMQFLGTYGFGFAADNAEEASAFFADMLYSKGGDFRHVNSYSGIKSFEFIQKLERRNTIAPETINWSKEDLARAFADGEVEMMANSLSAINILRYQTIHYHIGITPLPAENKASGMLYGDNIGVTVGADPEAETFLKYLYNENTVERIAYAMDTIPVLGNVDYRVKRIRPDDGEDIVRYFKANGFVMENFSSWQEISEEIQTGIDDTIKNDNSDLQKIADSTGSKIHTAILEQ